MQRNRNLPDFGDRYSANRTKDRQRREQQRLQQQQNHQQHQQQQPNQQPLTAQSQPKQSQQKFWSQPDQAPPRFQQQAANETNNLPPRFKKMILHQQAEDEVSLRPNSSMIFKPKTPSMLPKSAKPPSSNLNNIFDPTPGMNKKNCD